MVFKDSKKPARVETIFPPDFEAPILPENPPVPETLPTLGRTNRIYLLLMLLLIGISLLSTPLSNLRWLLMLIGDPLLLLAVVWFAAREGRPLRAALRLAWPGVRAMGLGLLLGLGGYAIAVLIQIILYMVFHHTQGVDIRSLIADPWLLGAFIVSSVLLAPVTEELMFRGYFLGIYERYLGPTVSLWLVALLFAAMHLQLLGMFSLMPVSILLTYMALRSGSLLPGMAAHFAFNLMGVSVSLIGLKWPVLAVGLLVCGLLIFGPAVGVVALRLFRRMVPAVPAPPVRPAPGAWLGRYWPLLLAGLIFISLASWILFRA